MSVNSCDQRSLVPAGNAIRVQCWRAEVLTGANLKHERAFVVAILGTFWQGCVRIRVSAQTSCVAPENMVHPRIPGWRKRLQRTDPRLGRAVSAGIMAVCKHSLFRPPPPWGLTSLNRPASGPPIPARRNRLPCRSRIRGLREYASRNSPMNREWRRHYNDQLPHGSLGNPAPSGFEKGSHWSWTSAIRPGAQGPSFARHRIRLSTPRSCITHPCRLRNAHLAASVHSCPT